MKKIVLSLFHFLLLFQLFGQDRIITQQHDTIHCRIINRSINGIVYENNDNGIITRKEIDLSTVFSIIVNKDSLNYINGSTKKRNDASLNSFSSPKIEKSYNFKIFSQNKPFITIQLESGYGNLISSTTHTVYDKLPIGFDKIDCNLYDRKLRNVFSNGISIHFNLLGFKRYVYSIGFNYQNQSNSVSLTGNFSYPDDLHYVYTTIDQNIFVNYLAIIDRHTIYLNKKESIAIYLEGRNGLTTYRNEFHYFLSPLLIASSSYGYSFKLGAQLPLAKNLTFDLGTGLFGTVFDSFWYKDQNSNQIINTLDERPESRVMYILTGGLSLKL